MTTSSNPPTGLRSMTGFAAISGDVGRWRFQGDVRSVNGRGLDLRLRIPDWIDGLEPVIREAIKGRISRGSVTLSLRVSRDDAQAAIALNSAQLDAALGLIEAIEARAMAKGVDLQPTRASDIAAMRGVIETQEVDEGDTKALSRAIGTAIKTALNDFDADRAREGAALALVLIEQLDTVDRLRIAAEAAAGDRAALARATLDRNLARLLDATEVPDEARLTQELALIAVKSDITEELDRLTAHVAAARGLLVEAGPVGRKLDFLMQEFNREANTLCSKAQSTELTAIGLDLKSVIDQMREQVQNIE